MVDLLEVELNGLVNGTIAEAAKEVVIFDAPAEGHDQRAVAKFPSPVALRKKPDIVSRPQFQQYVRFGTGAKRHFRARPPPSKIICDPT